MILEEMLDIPMKYILKLNYTIRKEKKIKNLKEIDDVLSKMKILYRGA